MSCLVCDNPRMTTYLDLGEQPLANTYAPIKVPGTPAPELPTYPLSIQYCDWCWHSQLAETVDPDLLFKDYPYVSGTSQTLDAYFDWFVQKVEADFVGRKLRVLDIAGNDGTLLAKFKARGHSVLNIDPAENLCSVSRDKGIPTVCGYWPDVLYCVSSLDVIIAMNVLGHTQNPVAFLSACREALAPGGRLYVQTSQCDMLETGEFDAIYHEHVSYFSDYSFRTLTRRVGLQVDDYERTPIHGGSHLWTVAREGLFALMPKNVDQTQRHLNFGRKAQERAALVEDTLSRYNRTKVGYGAAAKANTFLNFSGTKLDWMVDDNELKINTYAPGTGLEILAPYWLSATKDPLLIVVTAWNFYDEIYKKIKGIRDNPADLFCRYFPTVEICH